MSERETLCLEINTLLSFLKHSVECAEGLIGFVGDLLIEDNDSTGIGRESLNDLLSLSKKISSKADQLQNKIKEVNNSISK